MRRILGVAAGLVTAFTIFTIVQQFGHTVYPPPADLDPSDMETIKAYLELAPIGALLFVVFAYLIGTIAGAFIAVRVSADNTMMSAYIVGGVIAIAGAVNFLSIPHPTWMVVASFASYLFGTFAGGKLAGKTKTRSDSNE